MTYGERKNKQLITILSITGALVLGLIGWVFYNNYFTFYPLGSKLDYIGKSDYGCWWVCDSSPSSTYFYATDMSVNELKNYLHAAKFNQEPRTIDKVTDFSLQTKNGGSIPIYFYENKLDDNLTWRQLGKSNKNFIISIESSHYQTARNSL